MITGETWAVNDIDPSIATNEFYGLCFGPDKVVAVGHSGMVLYSYDGINWQKGTNPIPQRIIQSHLH